MIVMNNAQQAEVRGIGDPGHALEPVMLQSGVEWVLGEQVLSDPSHDDKWPLLNTFPKRAVSPSEYMQGDA